MALAATDGAELVLYNIHAEGGDEVILRRMEHHLDHLFNEAKLHGIKVISISETGMISRILPHRVQVEKADLVFYSLAPGESYGDTLQRQTSHQLLRTIRADLAVIRIMHMGKPHPRRILAPFGGIVTDREPRVKFLAALAKSFHSQVTLFHRSDAAKRKFPDDLVMVRKDLLRFSLPVLERSGSGRIDKAIELEAVSHHNDLIVLGASERGTLRRLFFGNPAGDVMLQPPCNVILFRPDRMKP